MLWQYIDEIAPEDQVFETALFGGPELVTCPYSGNKFFDAPKWFREEALEHGFKIVSTNVTDGSFDMVRLHVTSPALSR